MSRSSTADTGGYPDFGGFSFEQLSQWVNVNWDIYTAYLRDIVQPHADDERILLWDVSSEPFNNAISDAAVHTCRRFLARMHDTCKEFDVAAPLTVGVGPNNERMQRAEPLSDVITFHPYFAWNAWVPTAEDFTFFLDEAAAFGRQAGRPMLATETGWGALEDGKRCEVLTVELRELTRRGIGFTAHLLRHTLVADGHRPACGPITNAGYMAFIEADGSLRPGHALFNRY